ncbi:vitelline membrane protein 26Ab, putative [Ixodes scapularis]|uniref:Vitelline membrane protein 26Ab, putative n=1 Tax=Ixodes scapularis TaxID=6945 RepID=B7QID5_IXOSC|nr:vitelline membrane protein 26Ab, putative [Ixodes scapularis]|eukprot:XP_002414942.1 vitelline membrane protein 26Ab, putative [Ixodes scapularis]
MQFLSAVGFLALVASALAGGYGVAPVASYGATYAAPAVAVAPAAAHYGGAYAAPYGGYGVVAAPAVAKTVSYGATYHSPASWTLEQVPNLFHCRQ